MTTSPIITQLISFILMPIIARLYSPAFFGLFNLFSSLSGPLLTFSNFGYHQAIVLPEKDEEASNILYGNIAISFIVSAVFIFVLWQIPESLWADLKIISVKEFWWVIPFTVLFHGINSAFTVWNQRKTKFNFIAISRIINALINKVYILFVGYIGYATTGSLILGSFAGLFIMTFISAIPFLKNKLFIPNFKEIIIVLKKYKKFPIFILSSDLVFRSTSSIIFILLVYYFSESDAGHYGMAMMLSAAPAILIGTAIGEVFYQKAAAEIENQNRQRVYVQLFNKLFKLSLFSFIVLGIASEQIFIIFLGQEWQKAGTFTSILCFQMFIAFIMTPIINLAKIYNKQEYVLLEQFLILIFSTVSIYAGAFFNNVVIAIILLSVTTGLINLFIGLAIFRVVDIPYNQIFGIVIKYILYSLPLSSLLFLSINYFHFSNVGILLIALFALSIHYSFVLFTDSDLLKIMRGIIKKLG